MKQTSMKGLWLLYFSILDEQVIYCSIRNIRAFLKQHVSRQKMLVIPLPCTSSVINSFFMVFHFVSVQFIEVYILWDEVNRFKLCHWCGENYFQNRDSHWLPCFSTIWVDNDSLVRTPKFLDALEPFSILTLKQTHTNTVFSVVSYHHLSSCRENWVLNYWTNNYTFPCFAPWC